MTSFDVSAAAVVPVWRPPIEALRWVLVLVAVRVPVVSVLWGLTVAVVRGSNEPEPEIRDFCCIVAFTLCLLSHPHKMQCSTETSWVLKTKFYCITVRKLHLPILTANRSKISLAGEKNDGHLYLSGWVACRRFVWNFIRGWTGAPEKKNGVGGSIFMRVATVDLYESNNGGTECCIFAATKYMSRQGTAIVIFAMLHASLMPFFIE